jgi:hypothetical protein
MKFDFNRYIKSEDALFHYTKSSIALEKILYEKKLKFYLFKNSNDPREYGTTLISTVGSDLTQAGNISALELVTRINRMKSKCRVMCFCSNKKPTIILRDTRETEDEYSFSLGWNKPRMWAQYGENHFGMCLVFSIKKIKEEFEKRQNQYLIFKSDFVKYAQKYRHDLRAFDGNRLKNENVEDYLNTYLLENCEEFFFRKQADFRDESEYRVVVLDRDEKLEYIDIKPIICGVIVGNRASRVYYSLINELCQKLQIEPKRIHWESGKPMLIPIN